MNPLDERRRRNIILSDFDNIDSDSPLLFGLLALLGRVAATFLTLERRIASSSIDNGPSPFGLTPKSSNSLRISCLEEFFETSGKCLHGASVLSDAAFSLSKVNSIVVSIVAIF